jgi:hypothetical protein
VINLASGIGSGDYKASAVLDRNDSRHDGSVVKGNWQQQQRAVLVIESTKQRPIPKYRQYSKIALNETNNI